MKTAVKRILFVGYWSLPNCGELVAATSVAGPMKQGDVPFLGKFLHLTSLGQVKLPSLLTCFISRLHFVLVSWHNSLHGGKRVLELAQLGK